MNFEIAKWGNHRLLWINSSSISEGMKLYRKEGLDGVGISPHKGFRLNNLDFLIDYPDVIGVALPYAEGIDIGGLFALRRLKYLSIAGGNQKIDIGKFSEIEELSIEWHSSLYFPMQCTSLRTLLLKKYKSSSKSLTELPRFPNLERLELVQGNLTTLDGIQFFPKLRFAEFSFMRGLRDISAILQLEELEDLRFATCKEVEDFTVLESASKLLSLRIIDCGEIPSISFLDKIATLKEFRFVKTRISDGNLTPLIRLDKVGFLSSRHYSHTPEQVAELHARFNPNK